MMNRSNLRLFCFVTFATLLMVSVLSAYSLTNANETLVPAKDQKDLGDPGAIKELRDLVRMWDEASVKGDAATLDRLLADEFAFLGGPRKAPYLESVKSKSPDTYVESAVSDDVQVQVYGDTAVVTGLDTIKGKNRGQAFESKYLYMDVWVKRAGRWQCVKVYSVLSENK